MADNPFQRIPAVNAILTRPELAEFANSPLLSPAVRNELESLREKIITKKVIEQDFNTETIAIKVAHTLHSQMALQYRTTINATGIVLHTNMGRSVMADAAVQAATMAAGSYLNLEMDLTTGERSSRQKPLQKYLQEITGAEAGTVVNNCAAATVLVLRTLAANKEVIVSRGQLIEIGGAFRIPDIMKVSGAILKEVGTTNITRLSDYESAITPDTALLMRIHTSNYRVKGFTKEVGIADLVALGQRKGIPVVDDAGSGALMDFSPWGLPGEPVVQESINAGADIVLFSGDKLLGGPQAGIIVGKKVFIQKMEKDPLMRAFRCDKMTLAALEATLAIHRDPQRALQEIPTLRMLTMPLETIRVRAERLATRLQTLQDHIDVQLLQDEAFVGGGSLPDLALPTIVVALSPKHVSEQTLADRLRTGTPAVVARVKEGKVLLDLRTVIENQEDALSVAITSALTR